MAAIDRASLIRVLLPFFAFGYMGWWLGVKLIAVPQIQIFKILNVIGISFDLAGVVLLSQIVAKNPKYQAFVAGPLAEYLLGFFVSAHVGLILCSHFGPAGPSKLVLEQLSYGAFVYVMMGATFFITNFVIGVDIKLPWSVETRANLLGAFFLGAGITVQLIAAVLDLYS